MAPGAWIKLEHRSQGVTERHNTRPGYEGITDQKCAFRPDVEQGRLVQKIPEPTEVTETLDADAIEQVVPRDHDKRKRRDRPFRQGDKPSKHDHGSADDPDDPGKEKL